MKFTYPDISKDIKLEIFISRDLIWTIENGRLVEGDGLWGKAKYDFDGDFKIRSMIDGYEELDLASDGKIMENGRHRLMFRFPYNQGDIIAKKKTREGFFGNDYANFAEIKIKGRQPKLDTDENLFQVIGQLLLNKLEEIQQNNFVGKPANNNDENVGDFKNAA